MFVKDSQPLGRVLVSLVDNDGNVSELVTLLFM